MDTLATLMLRGMCDSEGAAFLDCEGEHGFVVAEEYTGGSRRVCCKCGLVRHQNTLLPPDINLNNVQDIPHKKGLFSRIFRKK